ncbi:MAG: hypothetical protein IIZ49_04400 [Oscillospiraceae bacterium]|nr:hypothetical protein [Oscillospiraceae bacterium]
MHDQDLPCSFIIKSILPQSARIRQAFSEKLRRMRAKACGEALLDFLFQGIEFGCREEFAERDIQPVAQFFDRNGTGIFAFSV